MRFHVVHHERSWRRVDNHLDCRYCPICGATVHGNYGQAAHRDWHVQLDAQLDQAATTDDQDGIPSQWAMAAGEEDDWQANDE